MQKAIDNLNKRGFEAIYVEKASEVLTVIDKYISNGRSIGIGGSMTVKELGVQDHLINRDCTIYGFGYYDADDLYQKAHTSDWYISSANAICESGDIVNIDGRSNRIGAIVSGPRNVMIIAGENKVVKDIEAGIYRTRNVAAPKNTVRLNRETPCRYTGKCSNCNSADTICNNTLIQHHPSSGSRVIVILVGESLGY